MKTYGGVDCIEPCIFKLGTSLEELLASNPIRFIPKERAPSTYWIGSWVGPNVDLEDMET
jgi:hypothetical protein